MGGKSKKTTVGFWYKPAFHAGLGIGPIDAFLQFRGGDKPAWQGELTSSGSISIYAPNLWGGEKDQGGIVGGVDVMFGEVDQQPNAYLTATFGAQQSAWRGLSTLVFKGGKYGAMNPYPQKASYKIRKIKKGWDNDDCWYPEKAEITMKAPPSSALYFALDLSGSMDTIASNGESRLTNMKTAINAVLDQVGEAAARGAAIDCMLVGFGVAPSTRVSILRRVVDAGGIADLKAWVSSRTASYGNTYFTAGVMDAPDFFTGAPAGAERFAFLVTDGEPNAGGGSALTPMEVAEEAGAVIAGIPDVSCYGVNIDLADTTYTSVVDNTDGDGVPVVSGGDPAALVGIIRGAIFGGVIGMNPAHILYYSRTQADMGREAPAIINEASFTAAADWYYGQGFGLCTSYDPSAESVDEFEQRICRVAGCSLTRSLVDGQWYLDVANGVYTLAELPVLSDDDILEFQEQPTLLDSAVNSVSVKYFDPDLKEAITTSPVQAPALIADFGTNHVTIEYLEIPTGELAARIAQRELQARITPLRGFPLRTTRKPYAWRPSTYFRLQVPKRGISDMVCIFSEKSSGQLRSGAMSISATQDVYSVPSASFIEVEPGVDTGPSQTAKPITLQRAFEAPYIEVVTALSRADLDVLPSETGFLMAVAADPATSRDYTLMTAPSGGSYSETGRGDWCPTALVVEAATVDPGQVEFTLSNGKLLGQVTVGTAALWDGELVRVDAIDAETGAVTFGRAVADTVPAEHAAGSRVWFFADYAAADVTEYTDGETVDVKLLTNTGSQQLGLSRATAISVTFDQRQFRPYPPANVRVNGEWPPTATLSGAVSVEWSHRDRIAQADQLMDWQAASIGPEAGVQYVVRAFDAISDALLYESDAITGTGDEFELTFSGTVRLQVVSVRDGVECWQAAEVQFQYINTSIQAFTASGTFVVPEGITTIDVLVVGGGGGGGSRQGGGGGAGGVVVATLAVTPAEEIAVVVGAGGAGGAAGGRGSNGGDSSFGAVSALGGGGGGGRTINPGGANGGSGGGSTLTIGLAGGLGTPGQGNNGGQATAGPGGGNLGGGGGGAGAPGSRPVPQNPATDYLADAGPGGAGVQFPMLAAYGDAGWFAGGGGGGGYNTLSVDGGGAGGQGGGGKGNGVGKDTPATNPGPGSAGMPNTGGGGGGSGSAAFDGGAGGSGVVIVSWPGGMLEPTITAPRAMTVTL